MTEANATNSIGVVKLRLRLPEEALRRHREAVRIAQQIGDRSTLIVALRNIGNVYRELERHDEATESHKEALALSRETHSKALETEILDELGRTQYRLGRFQEAYANHQLALAAGRQIGNAYQIAQAQSGMAAAAGALRRTDEARRLWTESLEYFAVHGRSEADEIRRCLAAL